MASSAAPPQLQPVADSKDFSFPAEERRILALWDELDAFHEQMRRTEGKPEYVFFDGPPFATGLPHYGHILAGTLKVCVLSRACSVCCSVRVHSCAQRAAPAAAARAHSADTHHHHQPPSTSQKRTHQTNKQKKDIVTRYASMTGHHVSRRFGWDCHGLPVEYEIDKKLEIKGRDDVLAMGIDKYNEECRSIVMR
jgi:isoleucyl-tRNA synthetase